MRRKDRLSAWALILIPFALLSVWQWPYGLGPDVDDHAQYLMHADALRQGRVYTDIGYIFTPYASHLGPAAYPPGFPVVLAPFLAVFGPNPTLLKLLITVFAAAFLVIVYEYFAAAEGRWMGVAVALVTGVALQAVYAPNEIIADLPFCALAWGVLLLADSPGGWRWRGVLMMSLLGTSAILVRAAGVPLIPAIPLFAIIRFREHRFRPLVPFAAWAGTVLLLVLLLPQSVPQLAQLVPQVLPAQHHNEPARLEAATRERPDILGRLYEYRYAVLESHLYPFPWKKANAGYHILSLILMVIGFIVSGRRFFPRFLLWFSVMYGLMLLFVDVFTGRYFLPLFPVAAFGFLNGVRWLVARARPAWSPERSSGFAATVAGCLGVLAVASHALEPRPQALLSMPAVQQLFVRLTEMKDREALRVVFIKPRVLAWTTGIPAMGVFNATAEETLVELHAKRITHLIVGTVNGILEAPIESLARAVSAKPEAFKLEYETGSFKVYRVLPEPELGAIVMPTGDSLVVTEVLEDPLDIDLIPAF